MRLERNASVDWFQQLFGDVVHGEKQRGKTAEPWVVLKGIHLAVGPVEDEVGGEDTADVRLLTEEIQVPLLNLVVIGLLVVEMRRARLRGCEQNYNATLDDG